MNYIFFVVFILKLPHLNEINTVVCNQNSLFSTRDFYIYSGKYNKSEKKGENLMDHSFKKSIMAHWFNLVNLFDKHKLTVKNDILSGLTVALALIPESVAFAFVAGVSPILSLQTAVMMGLVAAIFTGRPE